MAETRFGGAQSGKDNQKRTGLFERMKQAVARTRENLSARIDAVVGLGRAIDRDTLDQLETALIAADLGAATTHAVLEKLRQRAHRQPIAGAAELKSLLQQELLALLTPAAQPPRALEPPQVILVVGVNGSGKTTTIGKLAHALRAQGKSVLLCAADTFRAAAIEQLEIWGERTATPVIKTRPGGDPSAALFDALAAAKSRATDYLIADTAGRLHTQGNLMEELAKMKRTAARAVPGAPHEVLLVMDATTGQNGLQQARLFTQAAGVTGIVLTKLDGTAKGGVVLAISRELALPVRYAGIGEKVEDLIAFDPQAFVQALFN